jgi:hypothetical protein
LDWWLPSAARSRRPDRPHPRRPRVSTRCGGSPPEGAKLGFVASLRGVAMLERATIAIQALLDAALELAAATRRSRSPKRHRTPTERVVNDHGP